MVSRCVSPYHSWSHESARYSLLLRHAKVWNLASSPQMAPGRAEMTMFHVTIPIGSMVLVYMLTWLGYIDGIHVTIYSIHGSYGYYNYIIHGTHIFFWMTLQASEAFWVSGLCFMVFLAFGILNRSASWYRRPPCPSSPEVYSKNLQAGPIFTCQSNADMAALTLDQASCGTLACGLWWMG